MIDIFKIIENKEKEKGDKKGICIGIDIRIAKRDISCPLSKVCYSYDDFEGEVEEIESHLERIRGEAKRLLERPAEIAGFEFAPEMSPGEIWSILSGIQEESAFVERFNSLDDARRREVAEYVLTRCNIFSGKGAVFSARYDNETGYME